MSRMHPMEDYGRDISHKTSQAIDKHPDEAVLVAFVAGAAVGLLISTLLSGPEETTARKTRRAAENLGERLMASIERMLPDSLSSSLGMK